MVEADVSDGLEQLDEALSGLTSGKLKSSRLQSLSRTYTRCHSPETFREARKTAGGTLC